MIYKSYPKIFADKDEYKTNRKKKKFLWVNPSFDFYPHMLWILMYSNLKARRGVYDDYNWTASSLDVISRMEEVGCKFHFEGMSNLHKFEGPAVFISNHMSTLETTILPSIIQPIKPVVYVIKKELTTYPLFGKIAMARTPIVVGRSNPRDDLKIVLEEGSRNLQEGKSVIIFPQRTRDKKFIEKSFNTLGVKLAGRNNAYVVPVAIVTDAWGQSKVIKDIGKIDPSKEIHVAMGEPMKVKGNGAEEHKRVIDFIKGKLREWGREDLIKSD